jgi:hypothetical protein
VNAPLVGAVLNGVTEEGGYGSYASRYYTAENAAGNRERSRNGNGLALGPGRRNNRKHAERK